MRNIIKSALRNVRKLRMSREARQEELREAVARKRAMKRQRAAHHISEELFVARTVKVLFFIVLFAFGAWILFEARGILFTFIVAFLIASALDPLSLRLKQYRIPQWVTVLLVFILFFAFMTLFVSKLVPLFSSQLIDLAQKMGAFFAALQTADISEFPLKALHGPLYDLQKAIELGDLQEQLQNWLQVVAVELFKYKDDVWGALKFISTGILNFMLVLLIAYLMILERQSLNNFLFTIVPTKYEPYLVRNIASIREKMGAWLGGRVMLSLAVGIFTYIALLILDIPSAFTLGVMMGIFDIVPIIGPVLAWLFILPVAFNISFMTVVWATAAVMAVQWLENNVLVPYIMKKAMGIPSIAIVFSLLIGAHFFGIAGMILAIPIAAMVGLFWEEYIDRTD